MRLIAMLMLMLLAGIAVGEARMPEVGDHVMIEVSQTAFVNTIYDCFILNITDSLYCIRSIGYWQDGNWTDDKDPIKGKLGADICIGINSIKRIDWSKSSSAQ